MEKPAMSVKERFNTWRACKCIGIIAWCFGWLCPREYLRTLADWCHEFADSYRRALKGESE